MGTNYQLSEGCLFVQSTRWIFLTERLDWQNMIFYKHFLLYNKHRVTRVPSPFIGQNMSVTPLRAFSPFNILKCALCEAHLSLQQPLMTARASETRDLVMLVFSSNFGYIAVHRPHKNLELTKLST